VSSLSLSQLCHIRMRDSSLFHGLTPTPSVTHGKPQLFAVIFSDFTPVDPQNCTAC